MRITAEEKTATRKRIIDAAKSLFRSQGFEQTTTREIAKEVGIATGTMFNYFASKEDIVIELASQSFDKAHRAFRSQRRQQADLCEDLFAIVGEHFRSLRPLRSYLRPLLDTTLTAAPIPRADDSAAVLRRELHDQFVQILVDHGVEDPSSVQLNIFWALYVGALTFWCHDKSPKQEDSLALLDQSIRMYVDWLE